MLAGLAAVIGGLLTGVLILDGWARFGVSWGPDLTPVVQADVPPLGINVFLDKEPDAANIDRSLSMVRDGGYRWVRQSFPWYDIEIAGQGNFQDTRDGRNVSAWAKYDAIVDRAQANHLEILARIDAPPGWAHADGRVSHDPPANYQDFADFVATLVARYKGQVRYFQLWNEPNLGPEWGGKPNAADYTALLKAAYLAAKQANPEAVILMAPLAPTAELSASNTNDLVFLQQMYDAGAKDYFDIANVMVYGLGYPPEDRRTEFDRLNFSRPILTRQIMERNGDGGKAVWASEYAWISLPPGWTGKPSTWGRSVPEEVQAQYLVDGYRRARAEWPWMGVMFVWNFRTPDPQPGEPATYFAIVNQDFSPRPAYLALQDYAHRFPVADTGAHLPNSPALNLRMTWHGDGPSLAASTVVTATSPDGQGSIHFQGARVDLLLGANDYSTPVDLLLDGQPAPGWPVTAIATGRAVLPPAGSPGGARLAADPAWTARAGGPVWRLTAVDGADPRVPHTLVFHTAVETHTLALLGFVISREAPAAWAGGFPLVYGSLMVLLAWVIGRLLANLAAILDAVLAGVRRILPRRELAAWPVLPTPLALAALLALLAIYYWSPWAALAGAALAAWFGVALLRPDLAITLVLATVPFLFQRRVLGEWHFALAESTLLLTFLAVVVRRVFLPAPPPPPAPPAAANGSAPPGVIDNVPPAEVPPPPLPVHSAPPTPEPYKARVTPDAVEVAQMLAVRGTPDADETRPVVLPTVAAATPGVVPMPVVAAPPAPAPAPAPATPVPVIPASLTARLRARWQAWALRDAFGAPALAFLLVATFSLLTVADPGYLKNSLREYRWVIVEPVLFYFLATELLRGRRGAWQLADALVGGATFAALGALLFAVTGDVGLSVEGVTRVLWPYTHPNNLALFLGRVAPLAACVALFLTPSAAVWRRRLYALACVPLFVALLLTFSRGAYVGVLAAGLVVAWLAGRQRIVLALGGLAGAGAALLAAGSVLHILPAALPERLFGAGSTLLRFGLWRSALAMLRDHPIFGVGLDQFLPQYQYYIEESNYYESATSHPHNVILDFWLRLGIIGLLILGWTLARFMRGATALAQTADPARRALALGLIAGMTDFAVHGLLDNSYFVMDLAFVFWASCAMVQLLRQPDPETNPAS